jgi:hypothetical protein
MLESVLMKRADTAMSRDVNSHQHHLEHHTSDPEDDDDAASLGGGANNEDDDSKIFPQRLMEILGDERNITAICWLPHGRAFVIKSRKLFAELVMPRYFSRKAKYSSFTRKLNRWYVLFYFRTFRAFELIFVLLRDLLAFYLACRACTSLGLIRFSQHFCVRRNFIRVSSGPEIGSYYHEFFLRDKPQLAAQMFCKNARSKMAMASMDSDITNNSGHADGETSHSVLAAASASTMSVNDAMKGLAIDSKSVLTNSGLSPPGLLGNPLGAKISKHGGLSVNAVSPFPSAALLAALAQQKLPDSQLFQSSGGTNLHLLQRQMDLIQEEQRKQMDFLKRQHALQLHRLKQQQQQQIGLATRQSHLLLQAPGAHNLSRPQPTRLTVTQLASNQPSVFPMTQQQRPPGMIMMNQHSQSAQAPLNVNQMRFAAGGMPLAAAPGLVGTSSSVLHNSIPQSHGMLQPISTVATAPTGSNMDPAAASRLLQMRDVMEAQKQQRDRDGPMNSRASAA